MIETIPIPAAASETGVAPELMEAMHRRRNRFIDDLVAHGQMDRGFADSGVLDKFAYRYATGGDMVIHTLIGDSEGGGHSAGTIHALNTPGRTYASQVARPSTAAELAAENLSEETFKKLRDPGCTDPETGRLRQLWERSLQEREAFRSEQAVSEAGDYHANFVRIEVANPITGGVVSYRKRNGSSMFPDHWSAQKILCALLDIADTPPREINKQANGFLHYGEVDGVMIRVVTRLADGKIVTAYPIRFHQDPEVMWKW